jgi:hypothetical protein
MTFASRNLRAAAPAPAETLVTWDTASAIGGWTFSETNYRAASPTAGSTPDTTVYAVGSTLARSSGKRYFEILVNTKINTTNIDLIHDFGVSTSRPLRSGRDPGWAVSTDPDLFVYINVVYAGVNNDPPYAGGAIYSNIAGGFQGTLNDGAVAWSMPKLYAGDIFMCAMDFDNAWIYFGVNGGWYGSQFNPDFFSPLFTQGGPNLEKRQMFTFVPAGTYYIGANCRGNTNLDLTLKANTSRLTYPLPTGFLAWGAP